MISSRNRDKGLSNADVRFNVLALGDTEVVHRSRLSIRRAAILAEIPSVLGLRLLLARHVATPSEMVRHPVSWITTPSDVLIGGGSTPDWRGNQRNQSQERLLRASRRPVRTPSPSAKPIASYG